MNETQLLLAPACLRVTSELCTVAHALRISLDPLAGPPRWTRSATENNAIMQECRM